MNPSLSFSSILSRFRTLREEQFAAFREETGIPLSDELLKGCVGYYRDRARRDPSVAELRMLNRLASLPDLRAEQVLTRLETTDPTIAETYADVVRKQRELNADRPLPVHPGDILSAAGTYLARAGKESALPGLTVRILPLPEQALCGDGIPAPSAPFRLNLSEDERKTGIAQGDLFLLIRNEFLPAAEWETERQRPLHDDRLQARIRQFSLVGADGLLPALMSAASGIDVFLDEIDGGKHLPEWLIGREEGGLLLVIPPEKELFASICDTIPAGISCAVLAAATDDGRVTVRFRGTRLVWDTAFLRVLRTPTAVSAVLPEDGSADRVEHRPVTTDSCRYLESSELSYGQLTAHKATVAAAHIDAKNSPFRSAITALVTPVADLALAGKAYSDVRYAIGLSLPADSSDRATLSCLLGIYRAEAELGIPAASVAISEWENAYPSVTVFAVAAGERKLPNRFRKTRSDVYLAPVRIGANGLPDFAELRALLREVASLCAKGVIDSARFLAGESVTDTLRAMRTCASFCRLTDPSVAAGGPLPMAFLLESDKPLPFAKIGVTEAEADAADSAPSGFPAVLPRGKGLIWQPTREAVIFAQADDADAAILNDYFRESGICSHLFTGDDADSASRALMTANALLVCEGAGIPQTPRMEFAMRVMRANGGAVFSLGGTDPLDRSVPHRHLPDGLSRKFLI